MCFSFLVVLVGSLLSLHLDFQELLPLRLSNLLFFPFKSPADGLFKFFLSFLNSIEKEVLSGNADFTIVLTKRVDDRKGLSRQLFNFPGSLYNEAVLF